MRGIGQRAENIEDGANTDFAARWPDVPHSRMVSRGKHEAKADLLHAASNLFGTQVYLRSQCFKYIGAATTAGGGTVAVFCYCRASSSSEDTRTGRDIECSGAITACATGIQSVV